MDPLSDLQSCPTGVVKGLPIPGQVIDTAQAVDPLGQRETGLTGIGKRLITSPVVIQSRALLVYPLSHLQRPMTGTREQLAHDLRVRPVYQLPIHHPTDYLLLALQASTGTGVYRI